MLNYIANAGPAGIGMSDRWRIAQASMERAAIMNGHMDMLPHIQDFIAQQSHMGTLSNLNAADNALSQGNGALAAQFLAKAHAFFPDGTYARFGVDKSGQVWGVQFNEGSGAQLGQPVKITSDALRQQMIMLQNPTNYLQALQKYQYENAQIDLVKNHAEYYKQMPGIQEAKQEGINARQQDREEFQQQQQQDRFQHQTEMEQQRERHQEEMRSATAGSSDAADQRSVSGQINKDYGENYVPQQGEPAQPDARQAEVDTALRRDPKFGGAGMSGPMARQTARDFVNGKLTLKPAKDASGNIGYGMVDDQGNVRGYLSGAQADRVRGLAGTQRVAPPGQGKPAVVGAIGAGMGSQMAAMQGGQNLSGIPTQSQQLQPQQQSSFV
jgi:hypothetical protein